MILKTDLRNTRFRSDRAFFAKLTETQTSGFNTAQPKPAAKPVMKMQVYDMQHDTVLSKGKLVWDNGKEKKKPMDADTKNVVAAGTATWDMYYQIFGRNSVDNLVWF